MKRTDFAMPIIVIAALLFGMLFPRSEGWVINPDKCIGCGNCAEACVLPKSAALAVIDPNKIENIELHPAMFKSTKPGASTGIENRICPTDAIVRTQQNDSTWNYSIDETRCIGCGACTIRSKKKGSGAFSLKITDRCVSCNECSIAITCPTGAITRRGGRK